ncbi:uncharacterized protein LODBEIA_P45420 [Lodderomyces beijingensis]|uniref:Choline transport protein n=1 Tax=Lodderomyces beijingensis TaxID=1775926 RepID=A0ABP0ZQ83_9ASCO
MSDSLEKKGSNSKSSFGQGEVESMVSPVPPAKKLASILSFDGNGKDTRSKVLREAQANLDFVTDTGYKAELRRDFSLLSLLGIGFGITNSWFGISGAMVAGISSGGPVMIIYGIILLAIFGMCIGITLGEMASAYPNASGQIYWTMKLAPKKYSRVLSYAAGILSWLGSVFTSAAVEMAIATAVMGLYALSYPEATIERWQVFLVYEATNLLLIPFNIWEKPLPMISKITLYTSLVSFGIIIVVVLSMHEGDFQKPSFVFAEFQNGTGWKSGVIAFIVGLINPNWSFSCLDAATHIAEESLNPAVQIPQAIIGTVIVGFLTSFSYCIAMFFSIKDLTAIMESTTGVPIMDIFYQATNSKAAAIGLEVLVILTAFTCNMGCHTWQARICWSFSRDNGLPFSKYWSKVNTRTGSVVNAHLLSCFLNGVIGILYVASSTAFNSILVSCVTFLLLSYMVPTVFWIRERNNVKPGPFFMDKYHIGLFSSLMLCGWTIFAFIFYNFPAVMPVSGDNMNYSSAVFALVFIIFTCDWMIRGKKEYIGIEERESKKDELKVYMSDQLSIIEAEVAK